MPYACVRAFGNWKQMIRGMKNELLHVACSTKTLHVCHSLWQGELAHNHKQVVKQAQTPQGLSTLLFHRWSEVP